MAPNPHGTLSQERVSQAIDHTLSRATNEVRNLLRDRHYLTVRRVEDWGTILSNTGALDSHLQNRTPWHFGLVIHDDADQNDDWIGLVTFNIAYSSWSGRILYLDQMQGDGRLNDDVEKLLLQLLAEIAISLDCARLTWRVRIKTRICWAVNHSCLHLIPLTVVLIAFRLVTAPVDPRLALEWHEPTRNAWRGIDPFHG
jgi:hypothetical protein